MRSNPVKDDNEREEKAADSLPPRSAVHPSQKGRWVKIYYSVLLFIFILLTVSLMLWGNQLLK
ncbi:hypothetical protein [Marinicrinis lubricantis]|uniref:Uncharacterized protein n=1 Tax=Marinicrinis lubricantis TaxID=2086470 RepID=A0ABW1ITG5_9BACL